MAALQDRTTGKVALCSAIFAGFAYVGYAVVRQVFGGRREQEEEAAAALTGFFRDEGDVLGLAYEPGERRVFLRRLSGSRASSGLLVQEGAGLRPLSVRQRIKELNLGAAAFTDALLVVHGLKPRLSGRRSLPSSARHSPTRILSPVDLQLEWRRAEEEEEARRADLSPPGTPRLSRHSSRRHLARRSLAGSVASLSQAEQEEADMRAESLCQDREEELTRRLEGFQSSRPRELTPYEGRSLVALLHCEDREKIGRTLVTISNLAAFTRNQELLREAGVLVRLPPLLAGADRAVTMGAAMAAANLALNTANMKEMEQVVMVMVLMADDSTRDGELVTQLLVALTNLCVLEDWHHHLRPLLPTLLHLWHSRKERAVSLQAAKLLVNLACNDSMAASLLAAPCPPALPALLLPPEPEERLLRTVTLLANLAMAAQRRGLASGGQPGTLARRLFWEERQGVAAAAGRVMGSHGSADVRGVARKLHTVLQSVLPPG